MNNLVLKTIEVEGKEIVVTDSREIALKVNMRHDDLLKKIRGYKAILDEGVEDSEKLPSQKFFVEDTYINSQNKEQPCYQLTKQGCEMVANKMTGKRGVLFTATYVKAFNDMQEQLKSGQALTIPEDIIEELREAKSYYKIQPRTVHEFTDYIKKRLNISKANNEFEQVKIMVFARLQINKWSDINLSERKSVFELIDNCVTKVKKERPYEQLSCFS